MLKIPDCFTCRHYKSYRVIKKAESPDELDIVERYCDAFPEGSGGIPHFGEKKRDMECAKGISFTPIEQQ